MASTPDAAAVEATEPTTAVTGRRRTAPAAPGPRRGFPSATLHNSRVDALDGLRTLAVALVLVYHVDHTLVPGGSIAVDVFFTLSGFVITRQLLAEYSRTGSLTLLSFYRRRWLRLVPALLALCTVCMVLATTTSLWGFDGSWRAVGLAATFLTNVFRAADSGTYGGPLAHTWSLGVEEQFYLLWPLLLLGLLRRLRPRTVLTCTAALCVLPFLWRCLLWHPDALHRIYNGTDTRADELLAGALVAVVLARLRADDPRLALLRVWAGRLAFPALTLLALAAWKVPVTGNAGIWTALWYTVGILGVAAVSATLVAGLELRPDGWLNRLLALAPLTWTGRNLSYGIYLWHYPVLRLLASLNVNEGRLTGTVVLTVAMALLSYYFVERPFLRRAHRHRV
ncbi:acyltransferase [Streptomyces sp. NPDC006997]|uniref:acyltransferase family protein n=1 Tax=Streptomyces sp. NPDC006997 TaxID=3155356 RepID=UPI0033E8145F